MWTFAGIPLVPRNHGWFTAIMLFTCLAFAFVLVRLASRGFLVRKLGIDDYLMFLAMGLSIAWLVSVIEQIRRGLGDTVRLDQLEEFLFWLWWTIVFYSWCQWVIKLSILMQYLRLFDTDKAKRVLHVMLAWLIVYGIVNNITPIFMCVPVQKYWNGALPGKCMNFYALHYVLSTFNVINDLMLLIFPAFPLVHLHIPLRIKVILILTFTCGLFATVVSMMRFNAMVINASGALDQEPILGVQIVIWSGLEMNIAIVCGSVPAVKPFFTLMFPSLNFTMRTSASTPRKPTNALRGTSSKSGSARSWNPLNSMRKYGQGMSVLDDTMATRNDVELAEYGQQPKGGGISIMQSVHQTSSPAIDADDSSVKRLVGWDPEHNVHCNTNPVS